MSSKRRMYCSVYGCLNTSFSNKNITFFRLPADNKRRMTWLHQISREDLVNKSPGSYAVCEAHFHPDSILPGSKRKILKQPSVPTLLLPNVFKKDANVQTDLKYTKSRPGVIESGTPEIKTNNEGKAEASNDETGDSPMEICDFKTEPEDFEVDIVEHELQHVQSENTTNKQDATETEASVVKHEISNSSNGPAIELDRKDEYDNEQEDFFNVCNSYLTEELANLVKAQTYINVGRFKKHEDYLNLCFHLYLTNPRAYRRLQGILGLPTPLFLQNAFKITTELNETVFSTLGTKVRNMAYAEKYCSVVMNMIELEMNLFYSIKLDKIIGYSEFAERSSAIAKYALAITVRGMCADWQQPIAYAFLSESPHFNQIDEWIDKVLQKLLQVGLNVKTFVSNVSPEVYDIEKAKSFSIYEPHFTVNNKPIYYMFDATQLFTEIRDTLLMYNVKLGDKVVKFEHIVQFYNEDKKRTMKLAPHLTDSHIKPSVFEKDDLELATDVLSNTVAAAISLYVDFSVIEKSGKDTAEFIKMMNTVFDALYSPKEINCDNAISLINKMLEFFQELKFVHPLARRDVTYGDKIIRKYQVTLKSVLLLFNDLKKEGITSLSTKRLGYEGFTKELNQMRSKTVTNALPTARQFQIAFRKLFFRDIIKPSKCIKYDVKKLTVTFKKMMVEASQSNKNDIDEDLEEYNSIKIPSSEYNKLHIPAKDTLVVISGFLLQKCADIHKNCDVLDSYLEVGNTGIRYKRYHKYFEQTNGRLPVVFRDDFIKFIERMEEKFRKLYDKHHTGDAVASSIYKEMEHVTPTPPPCPCFPIAYMRKLFIRVRIFYSMKFVMTHVSAENKRMAKKRQDAYHSPCLCRL